MADTNYFDLFTVSWAQNGLTEPINDLQYKTGWAYIGSLPPTVEQFNQVQQGTDLRLNWLYKQLQSVATLTGRPLTEGGADTVAYALQNLNATNLKTGTVPVARLSGTAASLTAGAASKLATARTIAVSGDGTASVAFDGSANVSMPLTLAASGVTAATYGSANQVPTVTVDAKGRVTAAGAVAAGKAATATKLQTARALSMTGGATAAAVNFDGSGNVALNVTALDVSKATAGTLPVVRGGTGLATVPAGSFLSGAGTGALVPRTPVQLLADIGALSTSGGTVSGGTVLLGAGAAIGSQFGVANGTAQTVQLLLPDGGGYTSTTSGVTGAMKITLPTAATGVNTMIRLRVSLFEYLEAMPPTEVWISGYAQSSKIWARCSSTILGGTAAADLPVRLGSDADGRLCVWLGDLTKVWTYGTVTVSEVMVKHNALGAKLADWGTGWSVAPVTSFDTVSATVTSNLAFARTDVDRVAGLSDVIAVKADKTTVLTAGNGLTGGGDLSAGRTLTLGTPATVTASSTNTVTATGHSHAITIAPADIGAAAAATVITAGNGLTGGGTLAAGRTITLGTPATVTSSSTNTVTSTGHSHAISITPADIGAPAATTAITAGNGLTGGGTLAAATTLTLGTPGAITKTSTNGVTASSHTHQLVISPADIGAVASTDLVRAPARLMATSGMTSIALPADWRGKQVRATLIGGGAGGASGAAGSTNVGSGGGGGGGAGTLVTGTLTLPNAATIACVVGAGGYGGWNATDDSGRAGDDGGQTSIGTLQAAGGVSGSPGGGSGGVAARIFPGTGGLPGGHPGTPGMPLITGGFIVSGNGGNGASTQFGAGGRGGARSGLNNTSGGPGTGPDALSYGGGGGGGGGSVGPVPGGSGGSGQAGVIILELI